MTMTSPHIPNRDHMLALAHALERIKTKQFSKAEEIGLRVAAADPNNADAFFIAGLAAFESGSLETGLERLNTAITLQPDTPEYHNHRGVILAALNQLNAAADDFNHTLRLTPQDPSPLANLARVLLRQGQAQQALLPIQQALLCQPDNPTLLGDRAVILVACKQVHAALPLYEQALRLAPDNPEIHFNYSRALLLAGRYLEGWQENEWRWHSNHYQNVNKHLPAPLWDGSPLTGKTITILSEQGFGDALQFIRYAQLIQQPNTYVIVQCRPELTRLFQSAQGVDLALSLDQPLPDTDFCIPMFSLPLLFKTTQDTIPTTPYLTAPKEISPPYHLDPSRFHVGLVWSGANQRQFRFHDLEPLLQLPDITFHSLQPGPQAQLAQARGLLDCSPYLTDFAATAAIMNHLDLIITIDTAAAHLAGGLGRPFWLLTHATSDWRWGLEGTTSPWYPTARLFRQTTTGQWHTVIQQMTLELKEISHA